MFLKLPKSMNRHTRHSRNSSYQLLPQPKTHINEDDQDLKLSPSGLALPPPDSLQEAIFAAGSFCELEAAFGLADGVLKTATGYYGGTLQKPSYRQVYEGFTGHTEAVLVVYDTCRISYKSLCRIFWKSHDPTNKDFLGFGAGTHLRSAIFYRDEEQKRVARETKVERQMRLNKRIVTRIVPCGIIGFQVAEGDHQKRELQRRYVRLCESLRLRSTHQFVESHLACKLNGILCGGIDDGDAHQDLHRFVESHILPEEVTVVLKEIMQDIRLRSS